MKQIYTLIFFLSILTPSCKNVIDIPAQGILSEGQISSYKDAEGLVTAAYSRLGNDHFNHPFSLWPYGNTRSDDSYKGGNDPNDIVSYHFLENFQNIQPTIGHFDGIWFELYVGVRRANLAITALKKFDDGSNPDVKVRLGEMYFLRGYWYFKLKTLFKFVPYIDDEDDPAIYETISNREFTDQQLWELIAQDFKKAIDLLPVTQSDIGRANKSAANAYYAKTKLYKAYIQDDQHQVTSVSTPDLQEVLNATDEVMKSSYGLESDFANNFLPAPYENGKESIFAVQFSTDDGVGIVGRLDRGYYITAPQGLGCCDFQKISFNLVNAFKTTIQGVPDFDNYNQLQANFQQNTFDPRMDHTVARPGVPWKYNQSMIFTESWSRTPSIYGYFNSLKENVSPDCPCYKIDGPFRGNSKNRIEMRYADVLLMRAEALIELGRHNEALPLINQVRQRASSSTQRLRRSGQLLANYNVEVYLPGANINWNLENARKALRFERRLEFAMENTRFFDLVRWGMAAQTINDYYLLEKVRRPNIYNNESKFTKGRDEYLPIPQAQINWSKGLYIQNVGFN